MAQRLRHALSLLLGLRAHDLRAASICACSGLTYLPGGGLSVCWVGRGGRCSTTSRLPCPFAPRVDRVDRTPIWLAAGNPLADVPWCDDPSAALPATVDTVVIGAGFTGAACAYHWSKDV